MKVFESIDRQSGLNPEFADYPSAIYLESMGLDAQSLVIQENRSIELPGGTNVLPRRDLLNQGLVFEDLYLSKFQGVVSSFATDESVLIEPSMNVICDYGSLLVIYALDSALLSQKD